MQTNIQQVILPLQQEQVSIRNYVNALSGVVYNQYVHNKYLAGYITTTIGTNIGNYANTLSGVVYNQYV